MMVTGSEGKSAKMAMPERKVNTRHYAIMTEMGIFYFKQLFYLLPTNFIFE